MKNIFTISTNQDHCSKDKDESCANRKLLLKSKAPVFSPFVTNNSSTRH